MPIWISPSRSACSVRSPSTEQRCTALKIVFVHESNLPGVPWRGFRPGRRARAGMPGKRRADHALPERGKAEHLRGLGGLMRWGLGAIGVNPLGVRAGRGPSSLRRRGAGRCAHAPLAGGAVRPRGPVAPFRSVEEPLRWVVESTYRRKWSLFDGIRKRSAPHPIRWSIRSAGSTQQPVPARPGHLPSRRKDSAEGTLSVSDALPGLLDPCPGRGQGTEANKELVTSILRQRRSNWLSTDFIF